MSITIVPCQLSADEKAAGAMRHVKAGLPMRIEYNSETRTGTIWIKPYCTTDMGGAIELFRWIDPEVRQVQVYAGREPDITYMHVGGYEWDIQDHRHEAMMRRHGGVQP